LHYQCVPVPSSPGGGFRWPIRAVNEVPERVPAIRIHSEDAVTFKMCSVRLAMAIALDDRVAAGGAREAQFGVCLAGVAPWRGGKFRDSTPMAQQRAELLTGVAGIVRERRWFHGSIFCPATPR